MITCTSKKFIHVEEKVYTCPSCTQALEEGPGNLKKIYGLIQAERVGFGFQTFINYGSKQKKPSFSFLNLKKIMALSREK